MKTRNSETSKVEFAHTDGLQTSILFTCKMKMEKENI